VTFFILLFFLLSFASFRISIHFIKVEIFQVFYILLILSNDSLFGTRKDFF